MSAFLESNRYTSSDRKKSYLEFFIAALIACLINYSVVPSESSGDYGDQFSLLSRAMVWSLLFIFSFWFFRFRAIHKSVLFVFSVFSVLFLLSNVGGKYVSSSWVFYVATVILGAFLIHGAVQASTVFRRWFLRSLDIVIVVWVILFVFQIVFFFATGNVVDIHNFVIPYSEQRTEVLGAGFARLGGAHIEPGTYANWLYGVVLIKTFYTRNIFDRITIASMCTLPLCGSFWGVLAFLFYFISIFLSGGAGRLKSLMWVVGLLLVLTLLAFQVGILDQLYVYTADRLTLEDNSSQAKVQAYDGFWLNLTDYVFIGQSYDYDFCGGCYSPQDAGVFLNSVVRIGLFGAFLIFGVVVFSVFSAFGVAGVVLVVPMFFAKWYYWDHILWLVVFSSMYFQTKKYIK